MPASDHIVSPHGFHELARWLDHDAVRLRRIIAAFYRTTVRDLLDLEHAAAHDRWDEVRRFSRRIAIACAQIGEHRAAETMASLHEEHADVAARAIHRSVYGKHRGQMLDLIERAAALLFDEGPAV